MRVYDQIKAAFQDIVAPEIKALHGEIQVLRSEIRRLDEKTDSLKHELLAEIRRVDTRIDSLDQRMVTRMDAFSHELKTAMHIRERLVALEATMRA